MTWKQLLMDCVKASIQTKKITNQKFIDVILSPDVDGALSTLFVTAYAKTLNTRVNIIGTYNARCIRTVGGTTTEQLKNALWLDLDVRFPDVRFTIGQHFLGGPSVRTSIGSFNPNVYYRVTSMKEKYPFACCHFLFHGLLGDPDLTDVALAALAHADSAYWVSNKYAPNAKHWLHHMFSESTTMKRIVEPVYLETNSDAHLQFVTECAAKWTFPGNTKRRFNLADPLLAEKWVKTLGKQTCKIVNNEFHMSCVNGLVRELGAMFDMAPPECGDPQTTTMVWQGTKIRVEPSPYTEDLEAYLQQRGARSHACTQQRCISITEGPPLGVAPPGRAVEFF